MKSIFYFLFFIIIFPTYLFAGPQEISISDATLSEGDSGTTLMFFTVTATDNTAITDSVYYQTTDETATTLDNDYAASSGRAYFTGAGNTASISIVINGDATPEANETFLITISDPQGGNAMGSVANGTAAGTIINDDTQDWPPIMSEIPDQFAIKNLVYSLDVSSYVTQTNGDITTYSIDGTLPAGLTFNPTTGILSGEPTENGEFELEAMAIDENGNSEISEFVLTVNTGFCYEYSYSQQDVYFTESNTDGEPPKLVSGSRYIIANDSTYPIDLTLYIRHSSSLDITNLNVDILDINTTQVEYAVGTTKVRTMDELGGINITDDATTTISNIKNIPIGSVNYGDFFYVDYALNPKISILDTPINAEISFTINGNNSATLALGDNVPLCSQITGAGYTPVNAIFNVVHDDYYTSGSNTNYNLPTQVVKRAGNFTVIALEPDSDILQEISPVPVAIELIDVDLYGGDIEAACQEPSSAVSPMIWLVFDDNSSSKTFNQTTIQNAISDGMVSYLNYSKVITTASDFYQEAHKNVAFRTSYNYSANDEDLVQLSVVSGPGYNVDNFSDAVKEGNCAVDVDGIAGNVDTIAQFCDNSGAASSMTPAQLKTCLECVYGLSTRLTCSRDNFSIRPEAFQIKLNDQDQVNIAPKLPISSPANLAADYNYNIEVNATSHIDTIATIGYSGVYTETTINKAQYIWNGTSVLCNDDSNKSASIIFNDGEVDGNTSIQQVGNYILNITDTQWTKVDHDSNEMSHHTGEHFLTASIPDCIQDSTTTDGSVSLSSPRIGCNISSSHTNYNTVTVFNNYNTTFFPYKFDLTDVNASVGLNNTPITSNSNIYMADLNKSEDMSYHLNGNIRASGYYDSNLTNFTAGCYAKAVDINITKSAIQTVTVPYRYKFNTLDINDINISTITGDLNNSAGPIQLSEGNFSTSTAGSLNTNLNLNFHRENNNSINPQEIFFNTLSVDCTNANTDCQFSADLITTKTTQGAKDLNSSIGIKHYYGRTNGPRQSFTINPGTAFIYYEAYCSATDTEGVVCDKALLPNDVNSNFTNDPRWFKNTLHTVTTDGVAGSVNQKGFAIGAGSVIGTTATAVNPAQTTLSYLDSATKGYPYKTTMENNASSWLIYGKYYDITAQKNEFEVEFIGGTGEWAGEKEDNTNTTTKTGSTRTNRRSTW